MMAKKDHALPLAGCVNLSKLPNLSAPQFPHL